MTTSVGLHGLFAPTPGARDSKVNEDNTLASFAGVFAGVNQANAKPIVPTPQADGAPDGDASENAEDTSVAGGEAKDALMAGMPSTDVASATTVAAANPNAVNSSLATLNPALQEKLARVISRMREETGHDVQVIETFRSQARQDTLYAQGRETAGPVVTWTQNSKHTQGRAVDVTLDGGRASADAYTALQRIANEEGLRTLGAKDPGHLELPSSAATGAKVASVATVGSDAARGVSAAAPANSRSADAPAKGVVGGEVTIGDATGNSGDDDSLMPRIADIAAAPQDSPSRPGAKSFEISHLDRLSDAANASRVEDSSATPQPGAPKATTKAQIAAGAVQFRTPSIGRSANNSQGFNSNRQSSDRDASAYAAMSLRSDAPAGFSVADIATQMTSTASQRAERIMAALDAPARPLSQIVMSVDAGNGTTDRIQVALRGSTLSATIDAADHRTADAMRARSDDLVRSLTRDGVEVDSVRVRSAAATTSAAPVTTIDSSQKSSESSNHSRFNREAEWDQQRSQQRSNNERRQHQRDQRGGKES